LLDKSGVELSFLFRMPKVLARMRGNISGGDCK
jgi:hypothetical protein